MKSERKVRWFRSQVVCVQTDTDVDANTRKRTWYPWAFRWWPAHKGQALGLVRRSAWEDKGKERKLKAKDQARLDAAIATFQAGNVVACDQGLPMEHRHVGSAERASSAKIIAELSRKTYPRR